MAVIGTAGHVDHGKSTLLATLTGRNPDRWEEERRRGLTIDLGFGWATLPGGREVSFVDVPGHARFIKNMLAGIEAIDVALFVVAADEGWMPQSEEHLAVLDLLEVEKAVVALTKIDRVDPELVELVGLEAIERLEGTSLQGSAVVPVSAVANTGIADLLAELDRLVADPIDSFDPRLWVDRRFTVEGAGTVVTGTLLGGRLTTGQVLTAYPSLAEVRVRSIQSHEETVVEVGPHRRVAVNLVGAPTDLGRGTMLGLPGRWQASDAFTAYIRPARYVEGVSERGAYQVHVGSTAIPTRLRLIDDGALLRLDHPVTLRYGDRFILRETGRRAVVGGGTILDPSPPRRGHALRRSVDLDPHLDHQAAADALLDLRGSDLLARIVAHTGAVPSSPVIGDLAITSRAMERLGQRAIAIVSEFHAAAPLRPGMPLATLASQLDVELDVAVAVVTTTAELSGDGSMASLSGHAPTLDPAQKEAWVATRRLLEESGLAVPRIADLPIGIELIHRFIREGELVRVSEDLVFLPGAVEEITKAIRSMPDDFTVAQFRDRLGLSRKFVVPILEWTDGQGLTRRRGDVRSPARP